MGREYAGPSCMMQVAVTAVVQGFFLHCRLLALACRDVMPMNLPQDGPV